MEKRWEEKVVKNGKKCDDSSEIGILGSSSRPKFTIEWCSHFWMYSFLNMDMGSHQVENLFGYWFFGCCLYCSCFLERNNVSNSKKKPDIFMHWNWSKQTFEIGIAKCTKSVVNPATDGHFIHFNSTWKMFLPYVIFILKFEAHVHLWLWKHTMKCLLKLNWSKLIIYW